MDQDTWSYWIDIWLNYSDLLNAINRIELDFKVKIHFLEPSRLEKLYSKIDKSFFRNRLDFINISLQTSSQRILKLMNRSYNINNILDIILDIRKMNENVRVNTTFMYWFPTETFEEFQDYFRMVKYFDYTDFILYSEKKWLKLTELKKNSIPEIYKKYIYYQKLNKIFPNKIENSYFLKVDIMLMLKYLY
jgi:tRNA-2-methylthio-N6-dimethylallyladenosine synthase